MHKCPDCHSDLEKGYVMDHTHGAILVQRYAKGEIPTAPQKMVMGLYESTPSDVRRIYTYRCTGCNRLFNYAQDFLAVSNDRINNTNKIILLIIALTIVPLMIFFAMINLR